MDKPCNCEDRKLVRRECSNGAIQFGTQCQRCGHWQPVAKSKLTYAELAAAGTFEEGLGDPFWEQWRQQRQAAFDRERQQKSEQWWAWYTEYLKSEKWKDKSRRALVSVHEEFSIRVRKS